MASSPSCTAALLLLLALVIAPAADAVKNIVSSEPIAPPATCLGSLLPLVSPCLAFFQDHSGMSPPQECCERLGAIIQNQAVCLCHILNYNLELALGVELGERLPQLMDVCGHAPTQEGLDSCMGALPPLYVCPPPSA